MSEIPFLETHHVVARIARIYEYETGIDKEEFESEAYLRILAKLYRYRKPQTWASWCWFMAKEAATALIRRESYRRVVSLPANLEFHDSEPSPWLISQLQGLSDQESEAIVWTLGLDGTHHRGCGEVAHALGTTLDTIKQRKSKGLRKIREQLGSDYHPAFTHKHERLI